MLPLTLDLSDWPVLLVGDGRAALARLAMLDAAGARRLTVFAEAPSEAMRQGAGAARLVPRMPTDAEVAAARLLFVAGVPDAEAGRLAEVARAHRVLVNVEDVPPLCDAYALAMVRRGNLVIGVSTEGRSPAVARVLRQWLEARFGPEWESRLEQAAAMRDRMRTEGAAPPDITAATARMLEGWLEPPPPGAAAGATLGG